MDKDRIIEKIKKCLALGKSCEANEAVLALKRAQELMQKYEVTVDDIDLSKVNLEKAAVGKTMNPPRYQHYLVSMVKSVFGCEAILESKHTFKGWRTNVSFIGFGPSSEIAAYTFEVLLKQITQGRKVYLSSLSKQLKRTTKVRRGDLWAEAWVNAAYSKATVLSLSTERMDIINKWQAREYLNLKEARPRAVKNKGRGDHDAVRKGLEAGRNASLHHGMGGAGNGPLRIGG